MTRCHENTCGLSSAHKHGDVWYNAEDPAPCGSAMTQPSRPLQAWKWTSSVLSIAMLALMLVAFLIASSKQPAHPRTVTVDGVTCIGETWGVRCWKGGE